MTLKQFYEEMDGEEIDERLALALSETPEFKQKIADEKEAERVKSLSDEDRAKEMLALFGKNNGIS